MTKQEEMHPRLSEKIFDSMSDLILEPILVFDDKGNKWDIDKWLSYCKNGQIEIVSNKVISFNELKKEYEDQVQETTPGCSDSD